MQLLCDLDGHIVARNRAAGALGDIERLVELFDKPQEFEALRARNYLGADQTMFRLACGRQVIVAAAPVVVDTERFWQLVLHDVTTHALVGDDRQVARQLAAVGRLGRLVSNEITSPLAVLLGRIELLQTLGSPPPELLARHLTVMGEHARRIATVVQDLDALAVQGRGGLAPVGLRELIETVCDEHAASLSRLNLRVQLGTEDLYTSGHAHRLQQVLATLLIQLAGHLSQGARLSIAVSAVDNEVLLNLVAHASPRFAEVRRRMLRSWSADSDSQDLGAAVALSILVAHGGRLERAAPGPGLCLALPRRQPSSDVAEGLRVLFVDDDPSVVATTLAMLDSLGHEAIGVGSAEAALTSLAEGPFDAVVTDLVLPGLSGLGLRRIIAERWPGLEARTILVSGARQPPPESVRFVPKPYTRAHLAEALEQVLHEDSVSEVSVS